MSSLNEKNLNIYFSHIITLWLCLYMNYLSIHDITIQIPFVAIIIVSLYMCSNAWLVLFLQYITSPRWLLWGAGFVLLHILRKPRCFCHLCMKISFLTAVVTNLTGFTPSGGVYLTRLAIYICFIHLPQRHWADHDYLANVRTTCAIPI